MTESEYLKQKAEFKTLSRQIENVSSLRELTNLIDKSFLLTQSLRKHLGLKWFDDKEEN